MIQLYHLSMNSPSQVDFPGADRRTLVLTREAIAGMMSFGDYMTAVEDAFARYAAGTVSVPDVVHIPAPGGAFHIKSAGFTEPPFYVAVKVNGNFPDNPQLANLPTIQGAITLLDGRSGFPLAILDSGEITAQRTAAATAIAARRLANPESTVATIIGCGIQGRVQLRALLHVLPITQVYVFDADTELSQKFAEEMSVDRELSVTALDDFVEGTRVSHVIVTCTSSRSAFLKADHIQPGVFIAAVGADNPSKQELDTTLLGSCKVIVDITRQCVEGGELYHALKSGDMTEAAVHAELGQVVGGAKTGRGSRADSIIFDSTGSAIQDLGAAGIIYERAHAQGFGLPVALY